jgi:hypothetical protein
MGVINWIELVQPHLGRQRTAAQGLHRARRRRHLLRRARRRRYNKLTRLKAKAWKPGDVTFQVQGLSDQTRRLSSAMGQLD